MATVTTSNDTEITLSNGEILTKSELIDGDIIGLDNDGNIVQWDCFAQSMYNCGETPEQFGLDFISESEKKRLTA